MIRLIIKLQDCFTAAHVKGADTETRYKTFDVVLPAVEEVLRPVGSYNSSELIGAEILESESNKDTAS